MENYSDPCLNVTSIATHFDANVSYMSRIFKEGTGVNLLEFIHRTRINAAKELLETNAVKDVYTMVGFGDMQSFTRTFKKYEGITAAEYKKIKFENVNSDGLNSPIR
jgi:YesN/AraC family two-component response regulator